MLVCALLSAIIEFFLVGRVLKPMTALYLIEVPYSDIAWITIEFFNEIARYSCMILFAFLTVDIVSKSGRTLGRYLSAIGHFIPWSLLITWTILILWYALSDATSGVGMAVAYLVLYPPALIWLLWLAGNAISVAGDVSFLIGALAGLGATVFSFAAIYTLGWPIALALLLVSYFGWTHWRRSS